MPKTIKVGGLIVEVPDDSPLLSSPQRENQPKVVAERPAETLDPDPIAEVRIFQPNDPYRAAIDRVEMLGNLEKVEKPWVKRTFFVFFLLLPLSMGELAAFAALKNEPDPTVGWKLFFFLNFFTALLCTPYFFIWRRSTKAQARRTSAEA